MCSADFILGLSQNPGEYHNIPQQISTDFNRFQQISTEFHDDHGITEVNMMMAAATADHEAAAYWTGHERCYGDVV